VAMTASAIGLIQRCWLTLGLVVMRRWAPAASRFTNKHQPEDSGGACWAKGTPSTATFTRFTLQEINFPIELRTTPRWPPLSLPQLPVDRFPPLERAEPPG